MKIRDLLQQNTLSISFEVFPPKTESGFDSVRTATEEIARLRPAFMSESKGVAHTAYTGHSSADRYSAEGANYDATGRIYATHDSGISTTDTSGYFESRKEKWGKPTIINKGEYYKRTVEETRGLLGRDN